MEVIYGEDDRHDLYEIDDPRWRALALESTLALVTEHTLKSAGGERLSLNSPSFAELYGLCPSERFASEPSAAICSGVLIDEQVVLTAGHCVNSHIPCERQRWVFGYAQTSIDATRELYVEDVYECRSVLARSSDKNSDAGAMPDYAFIRLDRPVSSDKTPVHVRELRGLIAQSAVVIGYPGGLPVKIDTDATIAETPLPTPSYFSLDADTYVGSSGSGVFDRHGELLGILARGDADFEYVESKQCRVSRRLADGSAANSGEKAGSASDAVDALCSSGWTEGKLCSPAVPGCAALRQRSETSQAKVLPVVAVLVLLQRLKRRRTARSRIPPNAFPATGSSGRPSRQMGSSRLGALRRRTRPTTLSVTLSAVAGEQPRATLLPQSEGLHGRQ